MLANLINSKSDPAPNLGKQKLSLLPVYGPEDPNVAETDPRSVDFIDSISFEYIKEKKYIFFSQVIFI